MRLRTFTAPDMPSAMQMVRDALGDHAIILASESAKGGKKGISVTAAIDEREEPLIETPALQVKPTVTPAVSVPQNVADYDHIRFEIQNILRFHNLPELFVAKLLQKASDRELATIVYTYRAKGHDDARYLYRLVLEKLLDTYFTYEPLEFDSSHFRLMLVGPSGGGKTLTIAKIAAQLSLQEQNNLQNLTIITTDNKRAGGVEQLQAFTNILGLTLKVASNKTEFRDYIASLPPKTRILIDTAGCNPYDPIELQELKTYSALEGVEPILVLPAGGDSLEAIDMTEAFSILPIKRLLVTRADTARRMGGILAAAASHGLAFCHVSRSPSIVDALQTLNGGLLAQLLLRYQLQNK